MSDWGILMFEPATLVLRPQDRPPASPEVIPIQNRALLTYWQFVEMSKEEGDLFAVFSFEGQQDQVLHSKKSDFSYAVDRHLTTYDITMVDNFTILFLTGAFMVSRMHDFDILSFAKLVDHNMEKLFDRRDLMSWSAINPEFFTRPEHEPFDYESMDDQELVDMLLKQTVN